MIPYPLISFINWPWFVRRSPPPAGSRPPKADEFAATPSVQDKYLRQWSPIIVFRNMATGFRKWGCTPKTHRFQHSTGLLNDLGYPHFRKPPYGKIGIHGLWLGSVACAACDGKTGHQLAIPEKSSGPQQLFGLGSSLLQRIHLLLQLFQLLLPFFLPKVIGSSLAPWTSSILMLDAHGHATNLLVQFLLQPHGFQSNLPGSWKNQRLNGGSFRLHWSEAAEPLGLFIEMSLAT